MAIYTWHNRAGSTYHVDRDGYFPAHTLSLEITIPGINTNVNRVIAPGASAVYDSGHDPAAILPTKWKIKSNVAAGTFPAWESHILTKQSKYDFWICESKPELRFEVNYTETAMNDMRRTGKH